MLVLNRTVCLHFYWCEATRGWLESLSPARPASASGDGAGWICLSRAGFPCRIMPEQQGKIISFHQNTTTKIY